MNPKIANFPTCVLVGSLFPFYFGGEGGMGSENFRGPPWHMSLVLFIPRKNKKAQGYRY